MNIAVAEAMPASPLHTVAVSVVVAVVVVASCPFVVCFVSSGLVLLFFRVCGCRYLFSSFRSFGVLCLLLSWLSCQ